MTVKDCVRIGHRILNLIFIMIVGYLAGDCGMGFYFVTFILFQTLYILGVGGLKETVARMVDVRRKKGFHDNAQKIFRMGLFVALFIGAAVGLAFWFLGGSIMQTVYGYALPSSILMFFGIYYVLSAVNEVLAGYYQGMGNVGYCLISEIAESVVLMVAAPILIKKMYVYGNKVSALLKNPLYSNLNGSIGAVIAKCIAMAVGLVIIIVGIASVLRFGRDDYEVKGVDTKRSFVKTYVKTMISILEDKFIISLTLLVMTAVFVRAGIGLGANIKELFTCVGVFAGKYLVVLAFPFIIFMDYVDKEKRKLRADYSRDEHKTIRIRAGYLMKNSLYIMIPVCATVITLAKPIVMIFFDGKMSMGVTLVRSGGIVLLLAAISYACKTILRSVGLTMYSLIGSLVGFVSMLVFLVPSVSTSLNVNMLVYAFIVYYLVQAVAACVLTIRMVDVNIIDVGIKGVKVIIGTIILVIIEAVIDKFLVMNVIFLLITLVVAFAVYFIVVALLRGITRKDVNSLKGTLIYYPTYLVGGFFEG